MLNNRAAIDARNVLSGKDGALFDYEGTLLATVESFQAKLNISNNKYQPLGSSQECSSFKSFSVTLSFTQIVVKDDKFIDDVLNALEKGIMPDWSFQGVVQGRNGSQERMLYKDCVPDGNIDLQNISVGDVIKRSWSLFSNNVPKKMSNLTA